jgi:hypothetical protein
MCLYGGLFGPIGASLTGDPFTVVWQFDPGGYCSCPSGAPLILSDFGIDLIGTLTINGHSLVLDFGADDYANFPVTTI